MTAVLPITRDGANATAPGWRNALASLAASAAAILLLFHADAADMVRIWMGSSTFNHCIFILPIIGWLVWQRLLELRQLIPAPWAGGVAIVAAGAAAWLLGSAAGVALARHLGLVLMLQGLVIACCGKSVARGLAFPLFFAFFLVPAGQELEPVMQTLTARICMLLLGLVGIPAHLDGVFISIPTGYFEVAEACSGVKFLVAMLAYGALVANLCFRSWPRRVLFMAAAVIIPVLANGVRAWGTIFIASRTDNQFAEGMDHVIYGWFFFAFVIALLMGAGWRFFDRGPGDPWFDPKDLQTSPSVRAPASAFALAAGAAILLAATPLAWSRAMASTGTAPVPAELALPEVPGWIREPMQFGRPWTPHYEGADLLRVGHYRDAKGRSVDLAVAVYARQQDGREIVGYGQGAVGPDNVWAWTASGPAPSGGRLDRIASFGTNREVATFYRVGAILTGNPYEVKIETMKRRLLGGPQRAVAVLISAEAPADGVSPRPAIDDFLRALGPVDRLADRATEVR